MSLGYAIVEFIGEQSCGILAATWIEVDETGEGIGYYPVLKPTYHVKKYSIPDKERWPKVPIRVLSYADDYEKARLLEIKAAMTSNIESQSELDEESLVSCRKRPRKDLEKNDGIFVLNRTAKKKKSSTHILQGASDKTTNKNKSSTNFHHSVSGFSNLRDGNAICKKYSNKRNVRTVISSESDSDGSQDYIPERERINVDKNCFNLPEPPSLSAEAQHQNDSYTQKEVCPQLNSSRQSTDFDLCVKAMLSSLIVQQQALHMKLDRLEEGQQQLLGIMLNMAPNPNADIAELDSILQPKRTVKELNKFDQDLKSDIALRKKLILYLNGIGGHNIKECVRNILRKLGTAVLFSKYRKEEETNCLFKIYACRKSFPNATEIETGEAIGDALKYAPKQAKILTRSSEGEPEEDQEVVVEAQQL